MKALMGKLAAKILNDPQGRKQLTRLVHKGYTEGTVTLSNGEKYTVTVCRTKIMEN